MTPRELMFNTLEFKHSGRIPRQMWALPISRMKYPKELAALNKKYPSDISRPPKFLSQEPKITGIPHLPGKYVDSWGCVFENIHPGLVGEVKHPIIEDWSDTSKVHFPTEDFTIDKKKINEFCKDPEYFILTNCVARPFERLQFLRGTENLYIDIALEDPLMLAFAQKVHEHYLEEFSLWIDTDVDAIFFMDDWGSQKSLLIDPKQWRKIFKPFYKAYCDLAKSRGKKVFMHSDGYILDIYPDLIEIGVDVINSQIFCMGLDNLAQFAGKITFWGEIDRQHLLVEGSHEEIAHAVREVYAKLYANGGIIAQCEFGAGATPDRVETVFSTWESIQ